MTLLARFEQLDRLLVVAGFPPTSPWWRSRIERFVRSGRKRWVLEVGRRGGKSSTLCRLAVVVALWGEWSVPPGDTAVVAIVSVAREEASQRIVTIEAILKALGVKFDKRASEIDIPERRVKFSVRTCSTTWTIGFTSVMIWADEAAHWTSGDDYANPAREVMANLRPTMATQPTAFEVMCSAPWDMENYHHELMRAGDTGAQLADHAATWEANPTITKQETHDLEPDPKEWSRAYAAIPAESVQADWFSVALDRCTADPRCSEMVLPWVRYIVAIDPAFARDHFGWAVISSRTLAADPRSPPERLRRLTRIHAAGAWKVDRSPLEMAIRVRDELCIPWHVAQDSLNPSVYTDQYEGFSFSELARQAGVVLQVVPWTGGSGETSQLARYKATRLAMLEGCLQLPPVLHAADGVRPDGLASELRRVSSVLLPSGGERIVLPRARKDGHMDSVSAAVLGVSVALERAPQPEWIEPARMDEGERLRVEARNAVIKKRRGEDPLAGVRNMMRRVS